MSTMDRQRKTGLSSSRVVVPVTSSDEVLLDFIGPSHAVKDLFSLPYSLDKGVSVAVHNMNGTLLIDADTAAADAVDTKSRRTMKRPRPNEQHQNAARRLASDDDDHDVTITALAKVTSMLRLKNNDDEQQQQEEEENDEEENTSTRLSLPPPEYYNAPHLQDTRPPREYLSWNFRGLNLLVGSDALIYRHANQEALALRFENRSEMASLIRQQREMVRRGQFIPDYTTVATGKTYADVLSASTSKSKPQQQLENQSSNGKPAVSYAAPDLHQVRLQTCIVPSSTTPLGSLLSQATVETTTSTTEQSASLSSSLPVCTVLDAYLDNIMANVPQLALCLQEHGFIQGVKLLQTQEIPYSYIHASTIDTSMAPATTYEPPLFSPKIMEMNASTLLRFLKSNCTRDNTTYLLRREAGQTNVQLYDVTSISKTRQRKWIWWLAMMSYRFALRLQHLSGEDDMARRRNFRARQRSLLHTCLDLLEELNDMDGGAHETLCASVQEHLADSFLWSDSDQKEKNTGTAESKEDTSSSSTTAAPTLFTTNASPHYASVSVDSLTKAQDYLLNGIRVLWPLLDRTEQKFRHAKERRRGRPHNSKKVVVRTGSEDESSSSDDNDDDDTESVSLELQSIAMQLFGLHHKSINVSLRLAEHHLRTYFSSSAMRELRSAARRIADAIILVRGNDDIAQLQENLQSQFGWLWEHCGHFARSFAADELWRDRGHACGDDVISVLRDAEAAMQSIAQTEYRACMSDWIQRLTSSARLTEKSNNSVNLHAVSGIVDSAIYDSERNPSHPAIEQARKVLDRQKQIQRDRRRVLVAACISYSRAIAAMETSLFGQQNVDSTTRHTQSDENTQARPVVNADRDATVLAMLRQRLGDGCNELGKIMLTEVRALLTSPNSVGTIDTAAVADVFLSSAQFWFTEGLDMFHECQDFCNVALLRCNLCQCFKLRASSVFATPESGASHAEKCLKLAADNLQSAHEALAERDANPPVWDMVSDELAATFLVLGVRRRQSLVGAGTTPVILQQMRLSPGKERAIVEPMEQALEIYTQLGNTHQAAAVNYQMALFYSKVWKCQRDESKTREKLSKAFSCFGAAHAYFSRCPEGNEPTLVVLSLDMANLYAVVSGKECLSKALSLCLDTVTAFSFEAIDAALERQDERHGESDWFDNMSTLADKLEERIFKFLMDLVKIEKESCCSDDHTYKDMYRAGLTAKMAMKARDEKSGTPDYLSSFHELLVSMQEHERS